MPDSDGLFEESVPWDRPASALASLLAAWQAKGSVKCSGCGAEARMNLSIDGRTEYPYRFAVDWHAETSGWFAVSTAKPSGEVLRALYCPKCRPAQDSRLRMLR